MTASSIYQIPSVYDRIVPPGPCMAFYCGKRGKLAALSSSWRVALVASLYPTGRRSRSVCLDCSAQMLRAARDKARALSVKPMFVLTDMTSFHLEREFALIIASCNSLARLTSDEAISACLKRVAKHLAPRGLFAFDLANPDLFELGAAISQRGVTKSRCQGREIFAYDPVTQIQVVRFSDETGGPLKQFWPICLNVILAQEAVPRLWAAGLSFKRYGDFDGKPLCSASSNQVYIATGTASGTRMQDTGTTGAVT
ncbi:MAG: class I SAM-dependent methyltransferase [Mesorhizobium sp.]|nr:MAG: class I SAM-dependent methyltransferase [Mesorhizobium sp.]